ncbi:hypothetical protein M1D34_28570 (plasmid) [Ensifer sp. D2-11]
MGDLRMKHPPSQLQSLLTIALAKQPPLSNYHTFSVMFQLILNNALPLDTYYGVAFGKHGECAGVITTDNINYY